MTKFALLWYTDFYLQTIDTCHYTCMTTIYYRINKLSNSYGTTTEDCPCDDGGYRGIALTMMDGSRLWLVGGFPPLDRRGNPPVVARGPG